MKNDFTVEFLGTRSPNKICPMILLLLKIHYLSPKWGILRWWSCPWYVLADYLYTPSLLYRALRHWFTVYQFVFVLHGYFLSGPPYCTYAPTFLCTLDTWNAHDTSSSSSNAKGYHQFLDPDGSVGTVSLHVLERQIMCADLLHQNDAPEIGLHIS